MASSSDWDVEKQIVPITFSDSIFRSRRSTLKIQFKTYIGIDSIYSAVGAEKSTYVGIATEGTSNRARIL